MRFKSRPAREPDRLRRSHWDDVRGITRLETIIILLGFLALTAGFLYTVAVTGILAAERSEQAILSGLRHTAETLRLNGRVTGEANEDRTALDRLRFQVVAVSIGKRRVQLS